MDISCLLWLINLCTFEINCSLILPSGAKSCTHLVQCQTAKKLKDWGINSHFSWKQVTPRHTPTPSPFSLPHVPRLSTLHQQTNLVSVLNYICALPQDTLILCIHIPIPKSSFGRRLRSLHLVTLQYVQWRGEICLRLHVTVWLHSSLVAAWMYDVCNYQQKQRLPFFSPCQGVS